MEEFQYPTTPSRGPDPGAPLPPLSTGAAPQYPIETPPGEPLPPLQVPDTQLRQPRGGRGRKVILILVLVLVLLGGGVAVAALLFPSTNANTNTIVNTLNGNLTNRTNTNTTQNQNSISSNINSILTNVLNNTNAATNQTNVNTTANANTVGNANTANTNTSTNSSTNTTANTNSTTPPVSYTLDTDGDALNNYLELFMGTSITNADSDGDTYPDGTEVKNSFSPLGTGGLRAVELEARCQKSSIVKQFGLSATDVSAFCGIASDLLANIQVMATNTSFFEDLDLQRSRSCASFGKIDATSCVSTLQFILLDYIVHGA